jgi:hypothetical protein
MKLSVDLLDNDVKSAVINIGKNNGYIEAYIDARGDLTVIVYNPEGDIVHSYDTPWVKKKSGWTAPKFEPTTEE